MLDKDSDELKVLAMCKCVNKHQIVGAFYFAVQEIPKHHHNIQQPDQCSIKDSVSRQLISPVNVFIQLLRHVVAARKTLTVVPIFFFFDFCFVLWRAVLECQFKGRTQIFKFIDP